MTPRKEAKSKFEIHPVIWEAKIKTCSIEFSCKKIFCAFYSSIKFALLTQGNNFLFHLYLLI